MDLSPLAKLGKVAGIGGIALGVAVLLLRPVIDRSSSLSQPMQAWLLLAVVVGAFAIGLVGMILWWLGGRPGTQRARTDGAKSPARNVDRTSGGGAQDARTKGPNAPAINERGR